MQILMAPHKTIITIRDDKKPVNQLFDFIKKHFHTYTINQNILMLTYSSINHHKHTFLLKWIYALYKKTHIHENHKLREAMLNRFHQPLHFVMFREIEPIYSIRLHATTKQTIQAGLAASNYLLFIALQKQLAPLLRHIDYKNFSFEMMISNQEEINIVTSTLTQTQINGIKIQFDYGEDVKQLLEGDSNQEENIYFRALSFLDVTSDDDFSTIKKRYKNLLVRYHPDNVYKYGDAKIEEYTEIFQNLQLSFDVIKKNFHTL